MNKKQKRVRNSRSDIRARVIDALLRNRTPGFHFPGFFLGLEWIIAAKRVIVQSMPVGAHCTDAHGVAHIGAIGVMLDTGLALPRLKNDPFARHATVHVVTQFRESIPSGDIWMKVKSDGVTKGAAVKRALSSGSLTSPSGKRTPFCSASSALVSLPRPAGSVLAELPKNLTKRRTKISSKTLKLDEEEREILGVCDRAIASADATQLYRAFLGLLTSNVQRWCYVSPTDWATHDKPSKPCTRRNLAWMGCGDSKCCSTFVSSTFQFCGIIHQTRDGSGNDD